MSHRYSSSSKERSRERYHGYRGRSESSEDSYDKKKKADRGERKPHHYKGVEPVQPKRVRFSEEPETKIFRKEDEPCSKGLTEGELQQFMKKMELEKGSSSYGSTNWETMKHYEAQFEHNSIRQEKEREKALNEKLMGVREQMPYHAPISIHIREKKTKSAIVQGAEGSMSSERQALTARLNDVLGCFYVHQSQIPGDPSFQIQNTSTSSQPKNISFDKLIIHSSIRDENSKKASKDGKPLKGILKLSSPNATEENQPKKIDPKLVDLIRQIYSQKSKYSKDQIQTLLGPFKATGELAYVFSNKEILNAILNTPLPAPPAPTLQQAPPAPTLQQAPPAPTLQQNPAPLYNSAYPQPPRSQDRMSNSTSHERVPNPMMGQERNSNPRMNPPPPENYYRNSSSPLGQPTAMGQPRVFKQPSPMNNQPQRSYNPPNSAYGQFGQQYGGNQPNFRPNQSFGYGQVSHYGSSHQQSGPNHHQSGPNHHQSGPNHHQQSGPNHQQQSGPNHQQSGQYGQNQYQNQVYRQQQPSTGFGYPPKYPPGGEENPAVLKRYSPTRGSPSSHGQGQPPNSYLGQGQPPNNYSSGGAGMGGGYPQPPPLNRNYKTVPCKYFHSSQGCVKSEGCTFIHDEEYAGRPTPAMLKSNRGMIMQSHGMQNDANSGSGGFVYPPPYDQ